MRIISLWQPWAFLFCAGEKTVETRSRKAGFVGPLLIHAAKKWDNNLADICSSSPFEPMLQKQNSSVDGNAPATPHGLTFGAIIGMVYIVESFQMGDARSLDFIIMMQKKDPNRAYREIAFGDWSENRWGWVAERHTLFKDPIPLRGQQGIWRYDAPIPCPSCHTGNINQPNQEGWCPDCQWPHRKK